MNIKGKLRWDAKKLVPPSVLACIAIGYMAMASGFSDDTSAEAPMLYGTALLILSVLVFALALFPREDTAARRTRTKRSEGPFQWRVSFQIYAMIAGFLALVFVAGFYVAIPVFLFLFLRLVSGVSTVKALVFAACAYGFTWGVFSYFLHLEVFTGYLAGYV